MILSSLCEMGLQYGLTNLRHISQMAYEPEFQFLWKLFALITIPMIEAWWHFMIS